MNLLKPATLLLVIAVQNLAYAHDPSQHQQQGEKPNCEMMAEMKGKDELGMAEDDPVMQAMMKKCMASHSQESSDDEHANHSGAKTETSTEEAQEGESD